MSNPYRQPGTVTGAVSNPYCEGLHPEVAIIVQQTAPVYGPNPWADGGLFAGKFDGRWGVRSRSGWRGDGSPGRAMLWRGTIVQARALALDLNHVHPGSYFWHARLPADLRARAMREGYDSAVRKVVL